MIIKASQKRSDLLKRRRFDSGVASPAGKGCFPPTETLPSRWSGLWVVNFPRKIWINPSSNLRPPAPHCLPSLWAPPPPCLPTPTPTPAGPCYQLWPPPPLSSTSVIFRIALPRRGWSTEINEAVLSAHLVGGEEWGRGSRVGGGGGYRHQEAEITPSVCWCHLTAMRLVFSLNALTLLTKSTSLVPGMDHLHAAGKRRLIISEEAISSKITLKNEMSEVTPSSLFWKAWRPTDVGKGVNKTIKINQSYGVQR